MGRRRYLRLVRRPVARLSTTCTKMSSEVLILFELKLAVAPTTDQSDRPRSSCLLGQLASPARMW